MKWKIGDVTITKVLEKEMHWPFKALLPAATEEVVDGVPWLAPHYVDEAGKLILSVHCLAIESQGQRLLVDTCIGNDKDRPTRPFDGLDTSFLSDLEAAGFPRDSVDAVMCTHLHVDHVGWNTMLVDGVWVPTFSNARHLFDRTEYDHWVEAGPKELDIFGDVMGDSVAPIVDAGLADFVNGDGHKVTDEVWLESTPGHTPGHYSVRISSGGEDAVITGDMTHHPIQYAHPDLGSPADTDSATAIATRQSFIERYGDTPTLVIGTHFAGPTAGRIVSDGAAWRLDT